MKLNESLRKFTRLFSFIVLMCLCFSQVAFAVWWNPMTWKIFSKINNTNEVAEYKDIPLTIQSNSEYKNSVETHEQVLAIPQNRTEITLTSTPTVNIIKKVPVQESAKLKIIEKNYKTELLDLYDKKITFINIRIVLRKAAGSSGGSIAIKNAKNDIDFFIKSRSENESLEAKKINIEAVAFWKELIKEREKIIKYEDGIILDQEQILKILKKEREDINLKDFVSETEYRLKLDSLSKYLDEDTFENQYSEFDKYVLETIQYYNETNSKYYTLMTEIYEKDLKEVQSELAALKLSIDASRSQSAYYKSLTEKLSTEREKLQFQSTKVSCETSYSKGINYPVTVCTEYPTLKTFRCETSYSVTGNSTKNCY